MRKKLILTIIIAMCITVMIYYTKKENEIYYLALGDGITLGETPYNTFGYSYSDYIKEYLEEENILKFYTKNFAEEDMRIEDLVNQFESDKEIIINNKSISINEAINKANLVTITIGSTDLYYKLKINNNYLQSTEYKTMINDVDQIFVKMDEAIKYLKNIYKKDLYILGFYNPITNDNYINSSILTDIFEYTNKKFIKLSKKHDFIFIEVNSIINKNKELIPNPKSVHLNYRGYRLIGEHITDNWLD